MVVQRLMCRIHTFAEGEGCQGIAEWQSVVLIGYTLEGFKYVEANQSTGPVPVTTLWLVYGMSCGPCITSGYGDLKWV